MDHRPTERRLRPSRCATAGPFTQMGVLVGRLARVGVAAEELVFMLVTALQSADRSAAALAREYGVGYG